MTCIIGLERNGVVYLGADSAAVAGNTIEPTRIPKVVRVGRNVIVGYTTSFRMGQIISERVKFDGGSIWDFVEQVRTSLKDYGYAKVDNNSESGGSLLVGLDGCLYEIGDDYGVTRPTVGYTAIGCGAGFALGAMAALDHLDPELRILKSLEITARFSTGVCSPFTVISSIE